MKKFLSVMLVFMLMFALFVPGTALAASKSSGGQLVTGARQSGESKITFTVKGEKSAQVWYNVYLCNSKSSSKYFVSTGKQVRFGSCKRNQKVTVTVPVMGKYMIVSHSKNSKNREIDYVTVNYKKIAYSQKYKWTPARMATQGAAVLLADTAVGLIAASGCPACGIVYALVSGTTGIAIDIFSSPRNISVVPIKNYSWQYKYVPTSNGYEVYLLVYNTKNKLIHTYHTSTVTFK